jgi:hypothetical protein
MAHRLLLALLGVAAATATANAFAFLDADGFEAAVTGKKVSSPT